MVPYLCLRCRRVLSPFYFIWHLPNTQFRRARTKDHERSPGVVPTLKVVVWGADQKGQRRARCSDALPLVLARTDQEIALAAECLGSCPPAAPNPPSSYLPQTRHPVRVLITWEERQQVAGLDNRVSPGDATSHLEEVLGHDGGMQKRRVPRSKFANRRRTIRGHDLLRLWLGRARLIGSAVPLVSEGKDSNSDLLVGTASARAAQPGGRRPPFLRWWRRRRSWPRHQPRRQVGGGAFWLC